MEWVKDYKVKHKGRVISDCVYILVETVDQVTIIEIGYIDNYGKLETVTGTKDDFTFIEKTEVTYYE